MPPSREEKYLYIVEWDDSVISPPISIAHRITLRPEVKTNDFERYMREEMFSRMAAQETRSGRVEQQRLYRDVTGSTPDRFEMIDDSLESYGSQTSYSGFVEVGHWQRPPAEPES